MAVVLNATPMDPAANSYCTRAEADTILIDERMHRDVAWSALTGEQKDSCLVWACSIMEQAIEWNSDTWVTSDSQALSMPRSGLWDREEREVDKNTVPKLVKELQAELAYLLSQRDRTAEPELLGQGFSQGALPGGMSVTVDSSQVLSLIPDALLSRISHWGVARDESRLGSGIGFAKVVRT